MIIKGIYQIRSLATGEVLFTAGACDVARDWFEHLRLLTQGKHENEVLQSHFLQYGKDDLERVIIKKYDAIGRGKLEKEAKKYIPKKVREFIPRKRKARKKKTDDRKTGSNASEE